MKLIFEQYSENQTLEFFQKALRSNVLKNETNCQQNSVIQLLHVSIESGRSTLVVFGP